MHLLAGPNSRKAEADKAAIAQVVAAHWSEVEAWPLDLRERVAEVADMIRRANDLL